MSGVGGIVYDKVDISGGLNETIWKKSPGIEKILIIGK